MVNPVEFEQEDCRNRCVRGRSNVSHLPCYMCEADYFRAVVASVLRMYIFIIATTSRFRSCPSLRAVF